MKASAESATLGTPLISMNSNAQKAVFLVAALLCVTPIISPPIALMLGLLIANLAGNPFLKITGKLTKVLLQASVVGLGFGMNAASAIKAGSQGIVFVFASILGTLILGFLLSKLLRVESKTSHLISSGTAICGGSAIAAVGPVIGADTKQMSVALGAVFVLNSVALFVFPFIGHALHLTETQFGMWSAIAIHDTSSVVGAASRYGAQALEVATTVKLARALWIIPLSLGTALLYKNDRGRIKVPWFIGYFILAMVLNTYLPSVNLVAPYIVSMAKAGLTLTLFLIGAGLSFYLLKSVGVRPLMQAIILWVIISLAGLWAVLSFVV
jgi:uncharacterized integral membrane protein (TIGR00698 family)